MGLLQVFLLSALVAAGQAGPIKTIQADNTLCSQTCTENIKFQYRPGFIYQYKYHAQTTNKMNGASNNEATMTIDANVQIEPVSPCSLLMRVTDAGLQNSGDTSQRQVFSDAITRYPLKFTLQNGRIEDVCPMTEEPIWVLNIKRGILSAFQNSMDTLDRDVNITETDVVGSCLTKYNLKESNDRMKTVMKSKDLLNCNDRESYRVAIQSVKYNVPSHVKSLPLMKSSSECTQTLDMSNSIMMKSVCVEEHIFRPFSNGNSGAMTHQRQVLTFVDRQRPSVQTYERYGYRTNLLFQHEHGMPNQRDAEQTILSKLQELCQVMKDDVRPELPKMVNNLIDSMRHVDSGVLKKIHNKISRTSFCQQNVEIPKKYFLDAIPMVGTTASVQMIQDLISRKHVTGADAQLWLLSLSFIHHPSKEMIAAISPLLDDSEISGNTILAVSSLASSYCSVRPNCGADTEINDLVGKLVRMIGNCDQSNSKTIHALRALGNIGHTAQAVSRLSRCFTKKSNPMDVRVSAIDAFRRIPCDAMRSDLMGVFSDVTEDSEIRINAYLALMKCPNEMILMDLRDMLQKETSNQVGSFVWSHLTNLMETSDPHLQHIRSILEDENLKKEFNLDSRKFSRNYEGSFFFESINTGAKMDSNVIFSSKSFIPRSANLNLTVDLFGHAINILEVGGRIEGLETFLEKYFASYKTSKDADAEMDKIKAAIYMRMFGNELYYHSNVFSDPMSLFKKGESSLLKNMQLLDSRMVIPTCMGLPLNLTVTTTGGINYDSKHAFTKGKFNAEIKLSAAIEVKGEMCVDAHVTKTGLKMLTRAHTSSGVEVTTNKERAEIRFPRKKTEIFNLKSEFYTIQGETEKKENLITSNVQQSKSCTGQTMKTITGLRFCQELQYVDASSNKMAPFFPFTGPFAYDLYMINEDAPNNYIIEADFPGPNGYVMLDTPGSKVPRKCLFKLDGNTVFVSLPWRNLKMEVSAQNVPKGMAATSVLKLGKKEYNLITRLGKIPKKSGFKYSPYLKVTMSGKDVVVFESTISHDGKGKGNLEMNLDKVFSKPIYLNALTSMNVGKAKSRDTARIIFKSPQGSCKLNIDLDSKPLGISSRIIAIYNFGAKFSDRLTLSAKTRTVRTKNAATYSGTADLISKKSNWLNFNVKSKLTKTNNHLDTNVDLTYGNPKNKALNNLKVNSVINYKTKSVTRECNFAMSVKHPGQNVNFHVKADHFHTATSPMRKIENNIMLQVSPRYLVKTGLFYSNVKVKGLQNTDVKVSLAYPDRVMEFEEKLVQLNTNTYENEVCAQWQKDTMVKVKTTFRNSPKVVMVDNQLTLPNQKQAKLTTTLNMADRNYKAMTELHVDKQILSLEQNIDYKAVASVQYDTSKTDISGNGDLLLEWAQDRKISATASLVGVVGRRSTTKFSITTPFRSLQSYSETIERITTNKKCLYSSHSILRSNDNTDEMKQDMTLNSFDKEFEYNFSHMRNRVTTDVKIALKNNDIKKTAMMLVKQDKKTYLDVSMAHNVDRSQMNSDASLAFDMFDAKGHMKIALESDDREMTSSGDCEINLPNYRINSIGGSYSLKHNQAKSSINLGYTSSLRYYKNGEISAVLVKGLPKRLKGSVTVTSNNRELMKMNTEYTRQKDNFDVNAQMTGPDGKTMTASFNLNMSGARKTSHAEIKSGSIDASVDGAVEFEAGRYFDSEIRIGSGGKNLLLSGNYKIESSSHKINVHLGLPDSRQIKAQTVILNGERKTYSFNVDSPDFPSLTNMNMEVSYQTGGQDSMARASVKVLPYLEQLQLKASQSRDRTDASIELETHSDTIRQGKMTLSLKGNWRRYENINFETEFNDRKLFVFKGLYNVNSVDDFKVNMVATTSHKRYNEFSFDITHQNMESSLQIKAAREFMFNSNMKNQPKHTQISSKISLRNYDDWETQFVRTGDFDDMVMTLSHKIGNSDQYTSDMSIRKYGREVTLQIVTPNGVKFNMDLMVDPEDISLGLDLYLHTPSDNYEINAAYNHMSKIALKVVFPTHTCQMLMKLSGDLEKFQYQADITYDNEKYEFNLSNKDYFRRIQASLGTPSFNDLLDFTLDGQPEMFNLIFEAKHNEDAFLMKVSNEKFYKKITFDLKTPFNFETSIKMDNTLKNLNGMFSVLIRNTKYEIAYSTKGYYEQMRVAMSIPRHQVVVKSSIDAKKNGVTGDATLVYNKKRVTLGGSYKNFGRKMVIKGDLKAPTFNDDLTLTISGKLKKFNVVLKLQHNKDIYEVTASNKAYYKTLDINVYFPGVKAKLDFEGELKRFKAFAGVTIDKQQYKLVLSNQNYMKGINAELTTPELGHNELKFDFGGELRNFHLNTQLLRKKTEYSFATSVNVDSHSYTLSFKTPVFSLTGDVMNGFKSSSFKTKLINIYNSYQFAASNMNYFDYMSFNMSTPELGVQKLTLQRQDRSLSVRFQNNNDMYQCDISLENKDILISFSSPDNKGEIKAKLNEHVKDFSLSAQLTNNGKTYKVKMVNDNFKQMVARMTRPSSDDIEILVENTGNIANGKSHVKATFGNYLLDNNVDVQLNQRQFVMQMKSSVKSKQTAINFNVDIQTNFDTNEFSQSFIVNMNGRKSSVKTYVNLSRGLTASFDLDNTYTGDVHMKVDIEPMKLNRIKSSLVLKSQLTGVVTLVYQHELTRMSFKSKAHIETDSSSRLAGYDVEVSFQQKYSYNVKMDYKNEKYVITSKASHDDRSTSGNFQMRTPLRNLKDLTISAELDANRLMKASVSLPKQFYGVNFVNTGNGFNVELDLQRDTSDKEKQFKTSMRYVNNDSRSTFFRKIILKVMGDNGDLTGNFHIQKSSDMYTVKAEYSWGEKDSQKIGAELQMKTSSGSEALLSLILPRRTIQLTGNVQNYRNQHTAMFTLIPDANNRNEKIEITADISIESNNIYTMNTIVKFPNQKKGMHFKTIFTGRRGDTIFSSRFQFSADQDPRKALTLDMKLADNRGNYTFDFHVEQPYTKLAFIMMAYAAAKEGRISTGVELNYNSHRRYYDKYIIRTDINKVTQEAVFEVVSPKNHIEITGSLDTNKQYSVSLNKRESGMKDMQATASISPNAKNMHLQLNYDQANPEKVFHIDGEVMDKKLMMKAYRTSGQQKVNRDGKLIIEMRPSSILFFQLLWNTQMLKEITDYGFAVFQTYGQKIQTFGETIGKSVSEEFVSKVQDIKRVFKDDMEPIANYLPSVYNDIYRDVAKHTAKVAELYGRNVFYMKSMGDSVMGAWESMWISYQNNLVYMKRQMQEFNAYMSDKLDEAKIMVDSYYSDFENGYQAAKAKLFHQIDEMFLYVEQQFNNGFEHFTSLHQEINTYISKFPAVMKRVQDQIKKHPLIAKAVDYMVSMYEAMNNMKEEFIAEHGDISVLSHPMVDLLLSISNDIYKHVLKSYGYLHLEEVLPDLKNKVIRFVKKEVATLKKALTSIDLKVLVFDPKNGEISAQLYYHGLISAYRHLEDTSDSLDKVSRSFQKYSNKLSAFTDWTVYDTYYHVKPSSDVKNWVPPFKARASLFGGEHITTFDGRHLNFKGTCSYILARSEGNFKIVADYRNKGRQASVESISMTTKTGNKIRITRDSKVEVNDRVSKLPVSLSDVHIHRNGDLIVVEGTNGYTVSCNPKSDFYIVDISGWYYNKVGGLFGTYDNEKTNDMTMSNMHATNDLQEFANSWSTSRSCRSQNHARGHMVPENRKCAEMFMEPSSPFRNCFKQVNPNPFYHACASYMTSVNKPLKVLCDVSSYYVNQCHYNDVQLPIPIRCSTH
ncbi:apolipophorins-like [Octopus vulgaris]|uniref:Apolipophorins-like n=1 Tax=Octopus vulgaris TaxID=6645 RepID=A0AA36BYY7_OCTVU|nr:apolipophorins-like [Octopus vulgaris]